MATTGMTLKQFAHVRFFKAVNAYAEALKSGDKMAIVLTSLEVHAAKGGVPKTFWPLVNRTFRESFNAPGN